MVAPGVAKVGSVLGNSVPRCGKAVGKNCTSLLRDFDFDSKYYSKLSRSITFGR